MPRRRDGKKRAKSPDALRLNGFVDVNAIAARRAGKPCERA